MAVSSAEVSSANALSDQAVQAIESRLILQTSQAEQDLPVPLPTSDFWKLVSQLINQLKLKWMNVFEEKDGSKNSTSTKTKQHQMGNRI